MAVSTEIRGRRVSPCSSVWLARLREQVCSQEDGDPFVFYRTVHVGWKDALAVYETSCWSLDSYDKVDWDYRQADVPVSDRRAVLVDVWAFRCMAELRQDDPDALRWLRDNKVFDTKSSPCLVTAEWLWSLLDKGSSLIEGMGAEYALKWSVDTVRSACIFLSRLESVEASAHPVLKACGLSDSEGV